MRRARLLLLAVCVLCVARSAGAQWEATLDAGAATIRQAGIPSSGSFMFGGTLNGATQSTYFRSSLLGATSSGDDGWRGTGQAIALGGVVDPSPRLLRWELSGAATAFSQSAARPTTTAEVAAGFQSGTSLLGASLGGGGGFSAHARDVVPVRRVSGAGWWSVAAERVDIGVDLTHTRQQFYLAPSIGVTYVDGTASWRHEAHGMSLGTTLGYRAVSTGNVAKGAWGSGDAMFWLAPRAALVVSAGRSPADVVRGFPLATYASVALHISSRSHATVRASAARGPRITATRLSSEVVVLEIRVEGAQSVEVAGDFTSWTPIAMTRAGDVWRIERPISAGPHRLSLRVNGGDWIVPPNLPKVSDELGGAAAVITVP